MTKFYTLQECFEALGSKFPFTIDWHFNQEEHGEAFTIIGQDDDGNWVHEFNPSYTDTIFDGTFRNDKHFVYKIQQYKQDFDDLLK